MRASLDIYRLLFGISIVLAACNQAEPTASVPANSQSVPKISATPSVTFAQAVPDMTKTQPATSMPLPAEASPTPRPRPPRAIARQVLTEMSISTTRYYSADRRCEAEQLVAHPKDASRQKYGNRYFAYLTASCGGPELVLVDQWFEGGLGYPIPKVVGWSRDTRFLYFVDSIIPDGCSPAGGIQGDLRRVDLESGEIEPIPLDMTLGMMISPDSRNLIFYNPEGATLGLYNLESGEVKSISFDAGTGNDDYWYAGDFTWSPDSQSALFVLFYGDACFPSGTSIRKVDLRQAAVQTLIDKDERIFGIEDWVDPNQVLLSSGEEIWWMDPLNRDYLWLDPMTAELKRVEDK